MKQYMNFNSTQMQATEDGRFLSSDRVCSIVRKVWENRKGDLVTKANALRRTADDKQKEIEALDKEIAERLLVTKQ